MKCRSPLLQKLEGLELPPNLIVIVHVRFEDLANPAEIASADKAPDYTALSPDLIPTHKEPCSPIGILAPASTFSFTKTGIYSCTNTSSEKWGVLAKKSDWHLLRLSG